MISNRYHRLEFAHFITITNNIFHSHVDVLLYRTISRYGSSPFHLTLQQYTLWPH